MFLVHLWLRLFELQSHHSGFGSVVFLPVPKFMWGFVDVTRDFLDIKFGVEVPVFLYSRSERFWSRFSPFQFESHAHENFTFTFQFGTQEINFYCFLFAATDTFPIQVPLFPKELTSRFARLIVHVVHQSISVSHLPSPHPLLSFFPNKHSSVPSLPPVRSAFPARPPFCFPMQSRKYTNTE